MGECGGRAWGAVKAAHSGEAAPVPWPSTSASASLVKDATVEEQTPEVGWRNEQPPPAPDGCRGSRDYLAGERKAAYKVEQLKVLTYQSLRQHNLLWALLLMGVQIRDCVTRPICYHSRPNPALPAEPSPTPQPHLSPGGCLLTLRQTSWQGRTADKVC